MKKGINIWSFPDGMSVRECMALARKAGFDGIEPALAETGELSLDSGAQDIRAIRQFAKDEGIELSSLACMLHWTYPMTSPDAGVRKKAAYIVRRQIETAAELGVDTALVIPGLVAADFIPGSGVVPYAEAYERVREALSELAPFAESHRVSIGIENVWNKFLLSPLEMRDLIDAVGSDFVGAYFDVGNVMLTGFPEHWIAILGSRIKKVHFKDFRCEVGGLAGFVDLLAGDVNFPQVVKALADIGYDDYVIAEMIPRYKHHSAQIIYNTSGAMDAILGRN